MIDTTGMGQLEGGVRIEVPYSVPGYTQQRFEHLVEGVPLGCSINDHLSDTEKMGWELVAVTENEQGHLLFWKRPYRKGAQ